MKVRCPRCATIVTTEPGKTPICPSCGFGSERAPTVAPPAPVPQPSPFAVPTGPPPVMQPSASMPLEMLAKFPGNPLAGPGRRVGGFLIDLLVRCLVLVPFTVYIWSTYGEVVDTADGQALQLNDFYTVAWIGGWGVFTLVYYLFFEGIWGASPGKFAVGTRIVTSTGARPRFWQCLVRNLFRAVDGLLLYLIGFIMVAASPRRQRVGDRVATTFVVRKHG